MSGATTLAVTMSPKLLELAELARKDPQLRLRALAHLIDETALARAFQGLRRDAAVGVDGTTRDRYAENLSRNIRQLHERMKSQRYRHQPIRRVLIPKANGKKRPLGISCTEDKIVQAALTEVLTVVYEPVFRDCSYGFRPGRNAHDAVRALHAVTNAGEVGWILEADIEAFFDNIQRDLLMDMLRERIDDESLLRLVGKCLHVGVFDGENITETEEGTVQGSVLSPLLGNVYLHHVLDQWFEREVQPRLKKPAKLIRYADDFVIGFASQEDAERVMQVLFLRLQKHGLRLNPDKTRLVPFRRPNDGTGSDGPGTFDFLGFTWMWARGTNGRWSVRIETRAGRMRSAIAAITEWCRRNRHRPVREQHLGLKRRLQGHFNYFAVSGNSRKVWELRFWATRLWHKWLTRRSQRSRMTWDRFQVLLIAMPLPKPRTKPLLWTRAT
jgi:RNA-directed DNA polymerase